MKRILANNERLETKLGKLETEVDEMYEERRTLKDEVEDLKIKKKISEEDIKHMVKMREEKSDLEYLKKEVQLEKEHQLKLHEASNEYRDKTEKHLEKQAGEMKEVYTQIMKRLPNISARVDVK